MLNDKMIKEYSIGNELIKPFNINQLQPASYDVKLSNEFYKLSREYPFHNNKWVLEPNEFILGSTVETVNIPRSMVGRLEGKSSLGRIGLLVHSTAGFIDPGFNGKITLELKNIGDYPIKLNKDCLIGQLSFYMLVEEAVNPYNKVDNHYQGQDTVKNSVIEYDYDNEYFEVK